MFIFPIYNNIFIEGTYRLQVLQYKLLENILNSFSFDKYQRLCFGQWFLVSRPFISRSTNFILKKWNHIYYKLSYGLYSGYSSSSIKALVEGSTISPKTIISIQFKFYFENCQIIHNLCWYLPAVISFDLPWNVIVF